MQIWLLKIFLNVQIYELTAVNNLESEFTSDGPDNTLQQVNTLIFYVHEIMGWM